MRPPHLTHALLVALLVPAGVRAQRERETPTPFSLADILSAPFPTELVAAPNGLRIAWIGYQEGRRNVWVGEAPAFRARALTRYRADDGQELSGLTWTPDGRSLLFVRGGARNQAGEHPNPTSDPRGADQSVWIVSLAGGVPRRVGAGANPVPSPVGDRVALVRYDTVWMAPLRGREPARILFRARGRNASPAWSPDGRWLAFVSRRGEHSFIGVYDLRRDTIRWLSPGVDRDDFPRWSPDGRHLAFIRRPGSLSATALPAPAAGGAGVPPYTILVADAERWEARPVWRAPTTPDGSFPVLGGGWVLLWVTSERLLFAAELGGWLGLYAVPAAGGAATRLTPEGCEVQDVKLAPDRESVVYASNCGDIDRRHLQRVGVAGGAPQLLTSGATLEWSPQPLANGALAFLRSDARNPAAPFVLPAGAEEAVRVAGWPVPATFPAEQLVEPQQVVIRAPDSTAVHLQLFLPPDATGGRHPAVIFLHGGPQRQMLLGWHDRGYYHNAYAFNQYLASRGYVVLSVNFRAGIGYGRAFREAPNTGGNGASEYADLLAAAAYLRSRPDVDSSRIGLWGGSYGGYLTALGLARNSDLFAAGVDLHGVHDWAAITRQPRAADSVIARMREASPVSSVERWRSPVLLIHGDDDRNVEFQQSVELAQRLRRRGVHVEELVFPDEVHSFLLHRSWLAAFRAASEFFATRLGTRMAGRR